jgi:predicted phage tail protein
VLSPTASNADGTGPESSEVQVFVPTSPPPVGPPSNLTATVSGSTISFSWDPPLRGVPTGYVLWAGATPSVNPPLVTVPLGTAASFVANDVAAGTYYVFVQARNASSASGASNVVAVTVAGQPPPGAPTLSAPIVSGSTVSLSWTAGTGGAPTSYTLAVSATPGGAALVTVPLTGTSVLFANVPPGTYYLRLTATNAAGTSGPSAVVTLVVP